MSLQVKAIRQDYLSLLWPLLIEQVFMMLIGNVNVYLFSLYSDQAVAAIGISDQVLVIGTMFMGIISLGSTILFLQNAEEQRKLQVQGIARQTLFLNLTLGLLIIITTSFFANQIMKWMNTPEDIYDLAVLYLKIVSYSLVFQAISTSVSALLRSFGKVQAAMLLSIVTTILVIAGNALVVLSPFGWVKNTLLGIAVATVVSRLIGAILSILCLRYLLPNIWQGIFSHRQRDWSYAKDILKLGIPSGMENVSYNFSQTIITAIIASLGSVEISARIYTTAITSIVFTLSVAAGQAGQVIIGRLMRKNLLKEVKRFSLENLACFMSLAFILNVGIALASSWILSIFTSDPKIIALVSTLLWLNAVYDPCRVGNEIIIASLNVMGDVRYPVVTALIVTYCFTIPAAYLLGKVWQVGLMAIWLVFIMDEGLRLGLFIRRWARGDWAQQALNFQRGEEK